MTRYLGRRLLWSLLSILGAVAVVFLAIRLTGDPVRLMLPPEAGEAEAAALRETLGFNRPLWEQFVTYLGDLFSGNLGDSLFYGEPALGLVLQRLPATLGLALAAIVISTVVGLAAGIVMAAKRNTLIDAALSAVVQFCQSMPVFWIGILLILLFSVHLQWLPTSGFGSGWRSFILPALALSFYSAAPIARTTRASLIRVLDENFVLVSRAQGFTTGEILLRKVLKNALLPVVTVIGLEFGSMLGGAVVTETLFAWPGVGRLIMQGIANRDFPLVQAGILVVSVLYILTNFVIDLVYLRLNPRIRLE